MKKKYDNGIDYPNDFTQSDFLDSVSCQELIMDTVPMALMSMFEDPNAAPVSESKFAALEPAESIWDTPNITKYNK